MFVVNSQAAAVMNSQSSEMYELGETCTVR